MRQQTLQPLRFAMLLLDSRHVDQWVNNLDSQSCNITVASILMTNEVFCFNRTYFNRHERSQSPTKTNSSWCKQHIYYWLAQVFQLQYSMIFFGV